MREKLVTFCHLCCGRCSRTVVVEDGKVVDWNLERESGLPTEWCPVTKGISVMEVLPHPDRLKYPQKRVGARGEGKWARISWDEALDTIARKFTDLKEKYGPESVAIGLGEPKGMEFAFAQRFATAFGTPNVSTPGNICGTPNVVACAFTYGSAAIPDEEHFPKLMVLWGCNPIHTSGAMRRESLRSYLLEGAKLVVIDPKRIDIAKRADLWIKLRPGTDGALAMGILKVMIEEKLYDQDFVANWTVGFEQLEEHVKTFSLEDVERVTWVPPRQIEEFARLYGQVKPAAVQVGNALDNCMNSFQTLRAVDILRAISGNINVPGGDIFITPASFTRPGRFFLLSKLDRNLDRAIGSEFKLANRAAFIPTQSLTKAIIEEKPYPVKAAWFILTNPLLTYANTKETLEGLMKLDFLLVNEIFMTPTAAIADIVLPAATGAEHDAVGYWPGWFEEIRAYPQIVDPPGEAWSDAKIINEVAKRLGLGEYFWEKEEDALDEMLEPSGLTWEEFKKKRILKCKREYKRPEEGIFRTASRKVEIYSKPLEEQGYPPMPRWEDLSRILFETSDEYPLLLTNAKEEAYVLSGYHQIDYLKRIKPDPVVELHPQTAQKYGLREGEWIYIETETGKITQKLALDPDLDPRVVNASFGWWFPDDPDDYYGLHKSNINVLVPSAPEEETVGSVQMRGIPCRVSKA